ncbi:MAG: class I SAM-dependent methyltransferase [Spirochaetaceae bacterium]|jgi:cyclopropane fatty-acyl-phospholipid synthase-like methyltransferase|nr:class I SAM-dependent methyltransferase [Spirochaetaceae bacterium]
MKKILSWFEKESFWTRFAPVMFDSQRWAEAPAIAEAVCKIAGLGAGSSVLDAGCGPGRISVELAKLGPDVTGVDLIQPYLDAAAETAAAEGVELKLIRADLREFRADKPFDAVINMYTSFGYCDSIEEDMQILRSLRECVKPGGWFIMEALGREIAVRDFTEGEWFTRGELTVLTEFSVAGAWEGLRNRWIIIDEAGERTEHEFVQRLYSAVELKRLLLAAGFSSAEVYGDFDFSPYNEKARTMVLIARTKGS